MTASPTSPSGSSSCFTCCVVDGTAAVPGGAASGSLVVVNHRGDDTDSLGNVRHWPGWFVVSPVRHITRTFELAADERHALIDAVAAVDEAMTRRFGVRRSMVASLGWHVDDHLHVHVSPTWSQPTRGWLNFAHPPADVGVSPVNIAQQVFADLAEAEFPH